LSDAAAAARSAGKEAGSEAARAEAAGVKRDVIDTLERRMHAALDAALATIRSAYLGVWWGREGCCFGGAWKGGVARNKMNKKTMALPKNTQARRLAR
jgi:hypothetical protein